AHAPAFAKDGAFKLIFLNSRWASAQRPRHAYAALVYSGGVLAPSRATKLGLHQLTFVSSCLQRPLASSAEAGSTGPGGGNSRCACEAAVVDVVAAGVPPPLPQAASSATATHAKTLIGRSGDRGQNRRATPARNKTLTFRYETCTFHSDTKSSQ